MNSTQRTLIIGLMLVSCVVLVALHPDQFTSLASATFTGVLGFVAGRTNGERETAAAIVDRAQDDPIVAEMVAKLVGEKRIK